MNNKKLIYNIKSLLHIMLISIFLFPTFFKFRDYGYTSYAFRWFWFPDDISSSIRVFSCLFHDDNYCRLCGMVYIGYWIH